MNDKATYVSPENLVPCIRCRHPEPTSVFNPLYKERIRIYCPICGHCVKTPFYVSEALARLNWNDDNWWEDDDTSAGPAPEEEAATENG